MRMISKAEAQKGTKEVYIRKLKDQTYFDEETAAALNQLSAANTKVRVVDLLGTPQDAGISYAIAYGDKKIGGIPAGLLSDKPNAEPKVKKAKSDAKPAT